MLDTLLKIWNCGSTKPKNSDGKTALDIKLYRVMLILIALGIIKHLIF